MKTRNVWYVILNSHQARILHNLNDANDPEHRETTLSGPDRTLSEAFRDGPTRSYASAGGGIRSAVEPGTDPLREDALDFLRSLFDHLERQRVAEAFDDLVLVGSPDIVGLWRETVPDALNARVRREVIKNLVNLPSAELVPAVRALAL